jgi:hypothetical protein
VLPLGALLLAPVLDRRPAALHRLLRPCQSWCIVISHHVAAAPYTWRKSLRVEEKSKSGTA